MGAISLLHLSLLISVYAPVRSNENILVQCLDHVMVFQDAVHNHTYMI